MNTNDTETCMNNLGLQCDMQSCYLCDSCIFDEPLDNLGKEVVSTENNDNNMSIKKKFCNGCHKLQQLMINSSSQSYYNYYCNDTPSVGQRKLVDVSVPGNKQVEVPTWCPLCSAKKGSTTVLEEPKGKKSWDSLKAQIDFKEIKVGDVYHVPPYDGHKRQDIVITYRTEFSATYKVLNTDTVSSKIIETLFPYTPMMKVLTKHKIQDIKAQKV